MRLFYALLFVLLYSAPVVARSCSQTLTLGVGSNWLPFYAQVKGRHIGLDIEIVRQIMNEANICLRYYKMPSSTRAISALERGTIDFLFAMSYNPKRGKIGWYSKPYRHERIRIFWHPWQNQTQRPPATLKQLIDGGLRGVYNNGAYFGEELEQLKKSSGTQRLILVTSLAQRMGMLQRKRADFLVEDQLVGLHYLKTKGITDIELHPYVVFENEVSLLFSRQTITKPQVEQIDEIIKRNRARFDAILTERFNIAP